MEIFCACPFAVAALGWEPAPGRRSLSVCVKATFVLVPGAPASIAPLQDPIRADDGVAAPDLVPVKPRVDVLFGGHAHAPGGAPTDSLIARARVGAFRKSLSINGDRAWVPSFEGLRPSVAVPFQRMPLTYDRAVRTGENLAGVDISQGAELNRPLANIAAIAEQGGETPGLGPIPLAWRAMRYGMGEAALLWATRAGLGLGPPPAGFDFGVFNAAPAEQQLDDLPPGTEIALENLHPEQPALTSRLPAIRIKVFRRPPGSEQSTEQPTRCDTLWIDTDRGLAIAIWRSAVLLDEDDDASVGRLVVAAEADGERVGPPEVDRMLARFAPEVTYVDPGLLCGAPEPLVFPEVADPIPVPAQAAAPPIESPSRGAYAALDRGPVDEATPRAHDGYPPAPPAGADAARRPITLAPPAHPEASAVQPLPFRVPPTGFEASATGGYPPAPAPVAPGDAEDDEQTPPRGYPALGALHAVAPHDPYCAARMEAWQSDAPLGEVLARRGVDEAAFRAHEAAVLEAIGREGAAGESAAAVAVMDGLLAAEGRERGEAEELGRRALHAHVERPSLHVAHEEQVLLRGERVRRGHLLPLLDQLRRDGRNDHDVHRHLRRHGRQRDGALLVQRDAVRGQLPLKS